MRKTIFSIVLAAAVFTGGLFAYFGFDRQPAGGAEIPLEAVQLILPEGHPEFPADTTWVVVQSDAGPMEVPIPLAIPASWAGRVRVDASGSAARYLYSAAADLQTPVFSITALTEAEWAALQDEPHGEFLHRYGGIVWVYNPALENPYTGPQADEFSRMVGEAYDAAHSLAGYFTIPITQAAMLPVLQAYFDSLQAGNYAAAAQMYAGDYGVLAEYNPGIDPKDGAALFEAACTVNGFLCGLQIGEVLRVEPVSETALRFTVTLLNPDGSAFVLGPCCGEDPDAASVASFEFTVAAVDLVYRVMELPVLAP